MSSLTNLSNEELSIRIQSIKKDIAYLDNMNNNYGVREWYYRSHMEHYKRELQDLEIEKLKRNKGNLCKAVSRNKSRNAVTTLLSRPHYSEFPKTMTGRLFSSFVGETGLSRYILNHITGEDLLPNKDRVYLRELQDKISELPEEIVKNIWDKLSKKPCISNIRENHYLENEPMPERSNSSGGKRRRYKTRRK